MVLKKETKQKKTNQNKTVQRNRKQRCRELYPDYLHVQATPWLLHHNDTHDLKKLIFSYQNNFALP